MAMRRGGVAALAALGGALLAARGCSAHTGAPNETVAADGGQDAGAAAPSARPRAVCRAPTTVPDGIPTGWDFFGDLENCCQLYVPRSPSDLPAPVQWRACDSTARPQGLSCQQMVEDWLPDAVNSGISPWVLGDVQADGQVRLQVSRFTSTVNYRLIADADGLRRRPDFQAEGLHGGRRSSRFHLLRPGRPSRGLLARDGRS
ncbi:MAG TPA: hypothetical protein VKU41_19925 [Polyangiaceae bacterium]|nr:hypothetical protein [Polyangiaceae bacterium]